MKNTSLSSCHCALNGNSFARTSSLEIIASCRSSLNPVSTGCATTRKTNLVEAIAYLCNLESFRTRKTQQLWYSEANAARMTALLEQQQVLRQCKLFFQPEVVRFISALRNMSFLSGSEFYSGGRSVISRTSSRAATFLQQNHLHPGSKLLPSSSGLHQGIG